MDSHTKSEGPPFVGALLRLCWQRVRGRIYDAVRANGFTDLQEAHFAIFSYPLPHGVRPSDLGRQINMSRQATNYLVGQLEGLGYLERRAGADGERRLVFLTERGSKVADVIYATSSELQGQWANELGPARFATFMDVLRVLSSDQRPQTRARDAH